MSTTRIRRNDLSLLPNLVSLSRVVAVPLLIALLYFKLNYWATAIFVFAGISDYLDGWIARRYGYVSKLGMLLDPLADKLVILATMIMLLWIGHLDFFLQFYLSDLIAPIVVIVTVVREMAITGLRAIASIAGTAVPADRGGKLKTWIQFVAISLLVLGGQGFLQVGQILLLISVGAALWSATRYVLKFIKGLPE